VDFVEFVGFGIIFLSLKMNSTLLGHFILDFVNLVGLGVACFPLKVHFIVEFFIFSFFH